MSFLARKKGCPQRTSILEKVSGISPCLQGSSGQTRRSEKGPFVVLNCSALPEAIFESEMFGIEKGVAMGVDKRIGKIEQPKEGHCSLMR
ncbi:MAG: C4-dicarboxylate transport transcriptional regulatory protein DctD [Syntrophorhabdus sp. PtaU1.Bin050]|nr:MAG: C4-dicarboxylate transport transcriptional regulatory protein DctD [Syntrophorhabdus sp. PtaU1.Bin050]